MSEAINDDKQATTPRVQSVVRRGQKWNYEHGIIKIMVVADGYAMVRYKGATPFCVWVKDLIEHYSEST